MKKCLLLSIFCILLCTDRGKANKAQKLLNTLDLEEIVEKLEEFDVNQDGQLSEMEVELQQPGIQKYLDRYAELLKAEEDEKDDEEDADKKKDPKPNQKNVQNEKTEKQQKTDAQQTSTAQQKSNVQGDKTKQQKDTVTPSAASSNQQNKQEDQKQQTVKSAEPPAMEDEDDGVEIEVVEDLEFVNDNETQNYSNVPLSAIVFAVLLGIPTVLYIVCSKARAGWHAKQRQKEGQS